MEQRPPETAEDMMRRIAREEIEGYFKEHEFLVRHQWEMQPAVILKGRSSPTLSDLTIAEDPEDG